MGFAGRLGLRHKVLLVVLCILAVHSALSLIALHSILGGLVVESGSGWTEVVASVEVFYLVALGGLAVIAVAVAREAAGYLTRPLVDLTRIADQISVGDMHVTFDFGRHVRCWEIKRCNETSCRAYGNTEVQCWFVDGTPCRGVEPRFPQKLVQCRRCEVYLAHRGDEIVQLADSFQHMTHRLRESQAELLRTERLAATGEAVGMVSHSVKNILDGLSGGIYVYRRGRRLDDERSKAMGWDMIERNLGTISELVMNLLDFVKERKPFLEPCDPERMINDVVQLHQERADASGAVLEARSTGELAGIFLDAHAVFHCLVNLVTNALDALVPERPGRVEIEVGKEGDQVVFTVSDNGRGMSSDVKAKLFKGMFSTKGSKGTGLGLLSVQKAVREQGGRVEVLSEGGRGTTFRVLLPFITNAGAGPVAASPPAPASESPVAAVHERSP
ncbi:MAG: ATP-binding protein [Acidobacteriota bacterium]